MKEYRIVWIDASLKENYNGEHDLIKTWKEWGVDVTIEGEDNDWLDFHATHRFKAASDEEAKQYARSYDFAGRQVDVWGLEEGNREVFAENY